MGGRVVVLHARKILYPLPFWNKGFCERSFEKTSHPPSSVKKCRTVDLSAMGSDASTQQLYLKRKISSFGWVGGSYHCKGCVSQASELLRNSSKSCICSPTGSRTHVGTTKVILCSMHQTTCTLRRSVAQRASTTDHRDPSRSGCASISIRPSVGKYHTRKLNKTLNSLVSKWQGAVASCMCPERDSARVDRL